MSIEWQSCLAEAKLGDIPLSVSKRLGESNLIDGPINFSIDKSISLSLVLSNALYFFVSQSELKKK